MISRFRPAIINSLFFVTPLYKTHPMCFLPPLLPTPPCLVHADRTFVRPGETARINTVRRANTFNCPFLAGNSLRHSKRKMLARTRYEGGTQRVPKSERQRVPFVSAARPPVPCPSSYPIRPVSVLASSRFSRLARLERLGSSRKTITTVSCGLTSTGDVKVH